MHLHSSRRSLFLLCALLLAFFAAACGGSDSGDTALGSQTETETAAEDTTTATQTPTTTSAPAVTETTEPAPARTASEPAPTTIPQQETAFNGRPVPVAPTDAASAAAMFIAVQDGLRAEGSSQAEWSDLGHSEQLIIRKLGRESQWQEDFLAALPADYATIAELHLTARRELGLLHSGGPPPSERVPAWRVNDPLPMDELVALYQQGGAETGIDWRILAGINLVETGMGRIDGVSTAGAQGPMQFLPTTWDEVSQGGDINDPADAIPGAARYLVQRGGLDDIRQGLWGYNNSDHYVNAVLAYAELLEFDEATLRGFYNWEIYVGSAEGTLWLPVGYEELEPRSAADYVAENPWAPTLG